MSVTHEQILALLKDLEWSGGFEYEESFYKCCPNCHGVPGKVPPFPSGDILYGHALDCELAQMIADLTTEKSKETP